MSAATVSIGNGPELTLFNSEPAAAMLAARSETNAMLSQEHDRVGAVETALYHDGRAEAYNAAAVVVQRAYNELEVHLDCLVSNAHERGDHDEAWRIGAIRHKVRAVLGAA